MRSLTLCRERLNRLLRVLEAANAGISIRDLFRTFGIEWWEVEQAAKLGWIRVAKRKPRVGRPSFFAEILNENHTAKLPPYRYAVPKRISWKHRRFAECTQDVVTGRGFFCLRMRTKAGAYMLAYPKCRNRNAASAAASRLMKRTDVKLMIRWLQCELDHRVERPMPFTIPELIEQLEPLGVIRVIRR